jgi:UDP-N-acetylmuramoyl-L-alanyl-D-glutamate--2,6-diaminopimelate ligase
MLVIGVTGTDGKTTTSTLAHSVLSAHGLRTGLITTVAAQIDDQELDTGLHTTTPEAFDLQGYLSQMDNAGCQAVVLETTSHALDQERVAFIDYDTAVVTNVTHEHLDWHGTWDNYMAAKARLFRALDSSHRKPGIAKTAILNLEDRSYPILRTIRANRTITYATDAAAGAMVAAHDINVSDEGTRFRLMTPEGVADAWIAPIGAHNVANALAAAAVGLSVGASLEEIVRGLGVVKRVIGRMEYVYRGQFSVIVDFAHTPNALARTIATARMLVGPGGRVIVVFGSAGLRDVEKRCLMGEVAGAADLAVLTAEDPRTEDVNDIISAIASGLLARSKREGVDFLRVPDRVQAIDTAIGQARPGDLVICCGKAHERSMAFGTVETPWDEFAAVEAALARRNLSTT